MSSDNKKIRGALRRRMHLVEQHGQTLARLQDRWDQLALLGQMSGIATDIGATATEFAQLADTLLDTLSQRLLDNALAGLRGKAQVAVDVLVRNLFERTADVGFLATDPVLCRFVREPASRSDDARAAICRRLAAYVRKYSVYDDVLLLDAEGTVLARLDPTAPCGHRAGDPLVAQALRGDRPYIETYGPQAVLDGRTGLSYAAAMRNEAGMPCGVLCLSFRLQDELRGIFGQLLGEGTGGQLALLDGEGQVLLSSHPALLPAGTRLPPAQDEQRAHLLGDREVLRVAARPAGYQGYAGPQGWQALAVVPVELAFREDEDDRQDDGLRALAQRGEALFGEALTRIPRQAQHIQQGLEMSVWNGQIEARRQARDAAAGRFAGALLHQVADAGERIRTVFERAIADLQRSAAADVLRRADSAAALAVDILDRNLYERANDCRWWAQDPRLQQVLAGERGADEGARVLGGIHALYTVYAQLLLLDAAGRVVATSQPLADHGGQTVAGPWLARALSLSDDQGWARSGFEASPFYGGRPTLTYAAPVRRDAGAASGAVAIVFDTAPQLQAMLRDALPCGPDGAPLPQARAVFATRSGRVVACSDDSLAPGAALPWQPLLPVLAGLAPGAAAQQLLAAGDEQLSVALRMAGGYREYGSGQAPADEDIACLVLLSLGPQRAGLPGEGGGRAPVPGVAAAQARSVVLATFAVDGQWYALDADGLHGSLRVERLNAVPQRPAGHCGWTLHQGSVLPVVDLQRLQAGLPGEAPPHSLVIVCRGEDGRRMGLRADTLGSVHTVDATHLQPLPEAVAARSPLLQALVRGGGDAAPLLTVLSLPALLQRSIGAAQANSTALAG